MGLLTPPDPTEEVAQPALRPRSPTAEDPHPMIYTTCRGATPSPGAGSPTSPPSSQTSRPSGDEMREMSRRLPQMLPTCLCAGRAPSNCAGRSGTPRARPCWSRQVGLNCRYLGVGQAIFAAPSAVGISPALDHPSQDACRYPGEIQLTYLGEGAIPFRRRHGQGLPIIRVRAPSLDLALTKPRVTVAAGAEPGPSGRLSDLPSVFAAEGVPAGEDAVGQLLLEPCYAPSQARRALRCLRRPPGTAWADMVFPGGVHGSASSSGSGAHLCSVCRELAGAASKSGSFLSAAR
jgi:hypothetical protein